MANEDGSHRTTPPSTDGTVLASYERRLRHHLEEHALADAEDDDDES